MDFDTFMNVVKNVVGFLNDKAVEGQKRAEKDVESKMYRMSESELWNYYNNHSSERVRKIAEQVLRRKGLL